MHLSWNALGDDSVTDVHISGTVDGEEEGGHWIHISNATNGTTSYIDHHLLEPATTYVYTVGAQNGFGQGAHSEPVTVTTDPEKVEAASLNPPSSPLNVVAETVFEDNRQKVVLSWDEHASGEGVTAWQITSWHATTGDELGHVRYGARDHTFVSHEYLNVASSTTYVYTVHAINADGHGEYSERVTVTTGHEEAAPEPAATPTGQ